MRLIQRRGPFQIIDLFLERPTLDEIRSLQKRYARLSILTHEPLTVPPGFRLKQKKTPNIYLQDDVATILQGFRDTVRNEIHRTERLPGFTVRLPDVNKQEAYRLYREFEYGQGRAPISFKEFELFTLAGAYVDDKLVSAITFFQSGEKMRIRSIFSLRLKAKEEVSRDLYKVIGYASKRLMYEICRYGKEHGAISLDLASINLTDPSKESIARFKSGFGAKIEDEYQYVYSHPVFRFLEKIAAMKSRIRVLLRPLGGGR